MYIYLDLKGTVKEIINDEALRQTASGANSVYVYFEGANEESLLCSYELPDGAITPEAEVATTTEMGEIPYDDERDLVAFEYYKDYPFYHFALSDEALSQDGAVRMTLRFLDKDGQYIKAAGLIVFNVEAEVNQADSGVSQAQYNYLTKKWADTKTALPLDGSKPMQGHLDMSKYDIKLGGEFLKSWLNGLQEGIDTINATQNVVDIVGTKADLNAYETRDLHTKDKIEVLVDESQSEANTIYEWNGSAWSLIGSKAPYYSKSESDGRYGTKKEVEALEQDFQTLDDKKLPKDSFTAFYNDDYTLLNNRINNHFVFDDDNFSVMMTNSIAQWVAITNDQTILMKAGEDPELKIYESWVECFFNFQTDGDAVFKGTVEIPSVSSIKSNDKKEILAINGSSTSFYKYNSITPSDGITFKYNDYSYFDITLDFPNGRVVGRHGSDKQFSLNYSSLYLTTNDYPVQYGKGININIEGISYYVNKYITIKYPNKTENDTLACLSDIPTVEPQYQHSVTLTGSTISVSFTIMSKRADKIAEEDLYALFKGMTFTACGGFYAGKTHNIASHIVIGAGRSDTLLRSFNQTEQQVGEFNLSEFSSLSIGDNVVPL